MEISEIIKKIEAHRDAVGNRRDQLDSLIGELSDLKYSCEQAWEDLQRARDALSEHA